MSMDYTTLSEREIIMNLLPRVQHLEGGYSDLKASVHNLTQRLSETESRLMHRMDDGLSKVENKVDEQIGGVEKHLTEQDAHFTEQNAHLVRQSERIDSLITTRRSWPQGAIIFTTASAAMVSGILIQAFGHVLNI